MEIPEERTVQGAKPNKPQRINSKLLNTRNDYLVQNGKTHCLRKLGAIPERHVSKVVEESQGKNGQKKH